MPRRRIDDREQHAQFVTFSCYRRRRMLDSGPMRDALIGLLTQKLIDYRRVPLLARQQCEAGTRRPLPDKPDSGTHDSLLLAAEAGPA